MSDANKDVLRRLYAAMASGDEDVMRQCLAADPVDHDPDPGQGPGLDGVLEVFRQMRAAFSGLAMTPEMMVAEGDIVAARARITGTHTGEYMGVPATNKSFDVTVMDMVRFADGKLVERWGVFDAAGLMGQLGLLPG